MGTILLLLLSLGFACKKEKVITPVISPLINHEMSYTMPAEESPHEGTWLFWPQQYQFGLTYRNRLDTTWVALTKALSGSEKVHILAYDDTEKNRITGLLKHSAISLDSISFTISQTDDEWARDSGPIYVKDSTGQTVIEDWGFNGWGKKYDYSKNDRIPAKIAAEQNIPLKNLNTTMIVEGGALETDGNGTLLATKSAVLNSNRNSGMTQTKAEQILSKYYGVSHFIWLDGIAGLDITDMHIDGFAKFVHQNTLITMNKADLQYWEVPAADIHKLYKAKDKNGNAYKIIKLPLTQKNVMTTYGKKLAYKGSYINFYVANKVVLIPNYQDPNDSIANSQIQALFPTRTVIGIDVRNLYANGGMIHCVTQQEIR